MKKINVGGYKGNRHPEDWIIVDRNKAADVQCAVETGLPFKDNEIDAVYASMIMEHITPMDQKFVWKEFHRVLKKGGKIRIVVPDIDKAINRYVEGVPLRTASTPRKTRALPKFEICELQSWFVSFGKGGRFEHCMAFNYELLSWYLDDAKFSIIEKMNVEKKSDIFKKVDMTRYADCGLYVEAEK